MLHDSHKNTANYGRTGQNPTFDTVEDIMTLLMGLEERKEEARDNMCYFLQYEIDYAHDRKFHDEIINIRDNTDDVVPGPQ